MHVATHDISPKIVSPDHFMIWLVAFSSPKIARQHVTQKKWLVVSSRLNNMSQIGKLLQIEGKIQDIWSYHHQEKCYLKCAIMHPPPNFLKNGCLHPWETPTDAPVLCCIEVLLQNDQRQQGQRDKMPWTTAHAMRLLRPISPLEVWP